MKPDYWIFLLTLFFVRLFRFQKSCESKESRCREWSSNGEGEPSQSSGDGELDMWQIRIMRFEFCHEMCSPPIRLHMKPVVSLPPPLTLFTSAEVCLRRAAASQQLSGELQLSVNNPPQPHLGVWVRVQKSKSLVLWVLVDAVKAGSWGWPGDVITTPPSPPTPISLTWRELMAGFVSLCACNQRKSCQK